MAAVLIVDDDRQMNAALGEVVTELGHTVDAAYTLADGLERVRRNGCDVIFLDVRLPDGNGVDAVPAIRALPNAPEVIVVTAFDDAEEAARAITAGAWDYVRKPASIEEMTLPLIRAVQYRREHTRTNIDRLNRSHIIGSARRTMEALAKASEAAACDAGVLITGETGTGKELFARTIHENSSRAHRRFVVVDCAALPDTLVESILFGYRKGAFTGADRDRDGLLAEADGGTVFLDEIGELPLSLQKSFLRVLQERRFLPIGASEEVGSDFRVIAASNRDMERMAVEDRFRPDLLYRINAIPIELAPLRGRKEDIREIVLEYTERYCERYSLEPKGFAPEFFEALEVYNWPGNVRELINTLERVLSTARAERTLFHYHLPPAIRISFARAESGNGTAPAPVVPPMSMVHLPNDATAFPPLHEFRESMDRRYLTALLQATDGRRNAACEISGLSRSRFFDLLKKYRIRD